MYILYDNNNLKLFLLSFDDDTLYQFSNNDVKTNNQRIKAIRSMLIVK